MPYTTRELAEQCGISPQYVLRYIKNQGLENRLDKSTKSFVIPDDVAIQLITHFAGKEMETTEEQPKETDYYSEYVGYLKQQVEKLEKENAEKQKQISELLEQQGKLIEQNSALAEQVRELITTNKALAGTTALQEYDRVKPDELGQTTEIEADVLENDTQQTTQEQAQPKQEKKRGFWARLFGLD